jgi:hypothetical protein
MDDQLYSRRCDVKKPQLTIGYSAAFSSEEKPRSRRGTGLSIQGTLLCIYKSWRQANELPSGM